MLKKLRTKFVAIMMTFVAIMLVVIFGTIIFFTGASLEQESAQTMQTMLDNPKFFGGPNEQSTEVRLPCFVVQVGRRGEVLATGGRYFDLSDEDAVLEIVKAALAEEEDSGVLDAYKLRYSKATRPNGQVLVFVDITSQRVIMNSLIRGCTAIGIFAFGVFFVISLLLARWAVKPVEQAWEQQRQFVADASHELKTPLTVIMTNAELLQSGTGDEASRQQFSSSILTMSQQMRGLVEGLLELARVDNGAVKTSFETVDLSGLTADCLLPFEPLFFEKELMLYSDIESGITIKGSPAHLRQVQEILLDNAMKYSAPNGGVRVDLRKHGTHALLAVSSPGEPISQEDLKNIFKRFYRIDKARSRDGSYGLGLSIAQSIVAEHGGKIWAESRSGRNIFYVQLPM